MPTAINWLRSAEFARALRRRDSIQTHIGFVRLLAPRVVLAYGLLIIIKDQGLRTNDKFRTTPINVASFRKIYVGDDS